MRKSVWISGLPAAVFVAAMALGPASRAHHSPAAEFLIDQTSEVEGTVRSVRWANPHVYLSIDVQDPDGEVETWTVEAGSITSLRLQGLDRGFVTAGEPVRISGLPSRRNRPELFATHLFLEDGTEILLSEYADFLTDRAVEPAVDPAVVAESRRTADGLFRVWSTLLAVPESNSWQIQSDPISLTPGALEAVEDWDVANNPFASCRQRPVSMIMGGPTPWSFERQGEDILLKIEEFDTERVIHMVPGSGDDDYSLFGQSTGRWEGDTLVVETSNMEANYLEADGTPSSRQLRIVERFTVDASDSRLDYEMTITDPEVLSRPLVRSRYLVWRPEVELLPFDCSE